MKHLMRTVSIGRRLELTLISPLFSLSSSSLDLDPDDPLDADAIKIPVLAVDNPDDPSDQQESDAVLLLRATVNYQPHYWDVGLFGGQTRRSGSRVALNWKEQKLALSNKGFNRF